MDGEFVNSLLRLYINGVYFENKEYYTPAPSMQVHFKVRIQFYQELNLLCCLQAELSLTNAFKLVKMNILRLSMAILAFICFERR